MDGGDRSLDLLIITHLDSDHSRGLLDMLDRYAVGAVLSGQQPPGGAMQAQWERSLEKHGMEPVEVSAGYLIELDDGVELRVLNPARDNLFDDSNNDSIVLRLTYRDVSFLLTADIESESEDRLVKSDAELRSTVLKIARHGSNTSTIQPFLDALDSAIAVVSAGVNNLYGHPSSAVMERLETNAGTENVYRTDLQGNIEVISDGNAIWIRTER